MVPCFTVCTNEYINTSKNSDRRFVPPCLLANVSQCRPLLISGNDGRLHGIEPRHHARRAPRAHPGQVSIHYYTANNTPKTRHNSPKHVLHATLNPFVFTPSSTSRNTSGTFEVTRLGLHERSVCMGNVWRGAHWFAQGLVGTFVSAAGLFATPARALDRHVHVSSHRQPGTTKGVLRACDRFHASNHVHAPGGILSGDAESVRSYVP